MSPREILAFLPGYRQKVNKATYAHEKEQFLMLLGLAHEDGVSVQELETVFKRLIEHRQDLAITACQGARDEPPVTVRAPADTGV
jgi:hypothetical protein